MKMNAIERLDAFIRGEDPDRIPVYPLMMTRAARMIDLPFSQYCLDYKKQADAMIFAAEKVGAECIHPSGHPYCEAQAYGLEVEYPEDDLPLAKKHLINGEEQFTFVWPINPENHDFMMNRVKGVEYYREQKGDDLVICGHHEGVLAEYADLRGLGEACMDLYDYPDEMKSMLGIICENACRWGALQAAAGAHFMSIGDAACSQIGPDLYEEFVYPHHLKMVEFYHDLGVRVKFHICGDIRPILPMLIKTGADMIDVDHLVDDIGPFVDLLGPHQVFCGNLDPVSVIRDGTVERIQAEAEKWIRQSRGRGIISGGCEIPVDTSLENLLALYECGETLLPLWQDLKTTGCV